MGTPPPYYTWSESRRSRYFHRNHVQKRSTRRLQEFTDKTAAKTGNATEKILLTRNPIAVPSISLRDSHI